MKLLTEDLIEKFEKYPLYSQEKLPYKDRVAIASFFNPYGNGKWIILEGQKENDDYIMFGFADLGDERFAEFGYISLNELQRQSFYLGNSYLGGIEKDLTDPPYMPFYDACEKHLGYIPSFCLRQDAKTKNNEQEEDLEME